MSDVSIAGRWAELQRKERKALIPYLTAGFPSRDLSRAALRMVAEEGADFIEVGMPFSDPLADGPVIQRSTQMALDGGMTVAGTLALVREIQSPVPVIAFGYLNPILAYGLEKFLDDAAAAGVAGLLLTDLPAGEDPELERVVRASALSLISLFAPTTATGRARHVLADAKGFVYVIARLGVTGAVTQIGTSVAAAVDRVRQVCSLPVAVGFGIATGEQAAQVAGLADGVVVGSALVRTLAGGLDAARNLMRELRAAVDSVGTPVGS